MTRSATFLAISAAVLLAGAVALIGLRKKPANALKSPEFAAAATSGTATSPAPGLVRGSAGGEPPSASSLAAASIAPSATPTPLDERSLMSTLRELRGSDPERTLALARDGNRRFPDSPDVAERSWVVVKSLSDLGRHDEARAEGRILLERFRDTRWAEDVYRHLFVNPPTHPFERGYGKDLELE
ncbi:MAG: hypothetical protein ABUL60_34195 [Myxococcales bacterium]